jgi:hypothetical protein
MTHKFVRGIQRFIGWLFGAPFQDLPSEFGDTVPPELRAFEAEAEERQHHSRGHVSTLSQSAGESGANVGHK